MAVMPAMAVMSERRLAFVIPARNEEALIGETLEAILVSVARASGVSRNTLWLPNTPFDIIVANDGSDDATAEIVGKFADEAGVRLIACDGGTCAAARNAGAAASCARVLCFVDADTLVPENAVDRILQLHEGRAGAWCSTSSSRASLGSGRGSGGRSGDSRDTSRSRGPSRCRRS